MVVIIAAQDALAVALGVVVLAAPERPPEAHQTRQPQKQRHGYQYGKNVHRDPGIKDYFSRSAFSATVIEETDIASAAISGEASPTSAIGTAMML